MREAVMQPLEDLHRKGSDKLRTVDQGQTFLWSELKGLQPFLLQYSCRTESLSLVNTFAQPDKRQKAMRQRGQVPRGADGPLAGDDRQDLVVEMPEDAVHGRLGDAGEPFGEGVQLQNEHERNHLTGNRLAYSGAMAFQDIELQLPGLVFRDDGTAKRAEAGVDSINGCSPGDDGRNILTGGDNLLPRSGAEDGPAFTVGNGKGDAGRQLVFAEKKLFHVVG